MIAMADPRRPDGAAIRPFCEAGERLYCSGWQGEVPAGWELAVDTHMCLMRWEGVEPGPLVVRPLCTSSLGSRLVRGLDESTLPTTSKEVALYTQFSSMSGASIRA